jgi:hypothetical protein
VRRKAVSTAKDAGVPKAEAEDAPNKDDLIPRDRLIAQAREFTGYEPHEVAGALHSEKGDAFDPKDVKQLVRDWLKKPEEVA